MNVQLIEKDGRPVFAVLPFEDYQELLDKVQENRRLTALDKPTAALETGEETFPLEFVEKLIETDSKLREWRKYRGMTQVQLADHTGLSQGAIASIGLGKRVPQMETARRLARALRCDSEDFFG